MLNDAEAAVPEVSEAVEVAPEMRELDPADTHLVIRGVSVAQTDCCSLSMIWLGGHRGH